MAGALISVDARSFTTVPEVEEFWCDVYLCGAPRPNASSLNYLAGQTIPNAVITTLAADGTISLYALTGTQLIVDVNGSYPAGS